MLKQLVKVSLLLSFVAASSFASAELITANAELNYEQEVSPSNSAPSTATGNATVIFDSESLTLDIAASVVGIFLPDTTFPDGTGLAFGAAGPFHIHVGDAGENGPVVVPFNLASYFTISDSGFTVAATGIAFDSQLLDDLSAGGLYLNLHSLDYGSGEIRGQLAVVSAPSVAAMFIPAGLFAFMRKR